MSESPVLEALANPALWDLSRKDWQERIVKGLSLIPDGLPLDLEEAQRHIQIFNRLHLPDVPSKPALGVAAGDWFREILGALFGSMGPVERMIREVFVLVPKKNSKTTYGAALMLTALVANQRPRAEFLMIGPTREIADLAFSQAVGMIQEDPDGFLQQRMHLQEVTKTITDRRTKAKLKIKTFDTSVLTGVKPAGVLIDELHEISKDSHALSVIGQIRGGLIPNPEGFLVMITTQSDKEPSGAFKSELEYARKIRDGLAFGRMLPVLYEFPDAIAKSKAKPQPWRDPSSWWMVTPNLNRPVTLSRLREEFDTALMKGDEETARWASQHLNIQIGTSLSFDRWSGADGWDKAEDPELTLDDLIARCEVAVVGIDGGGLDDMLGVGVIGREKKTRKYLHWGHAWIHEIALERRPSEVPTWRDLEKAGDLTILPTGDASDFREVADLCEQLQDDGILAEEHAIGVDPVGLGQILEEILGRKVDGNPAGDSKIDAKRIVGIPQGWRLNGAIQTTERKISDGELKHCGQALMRYSVSNARIEPHGNAVSITKQISGRAKIDALCALFNAVELMRQNPAPTQARSTYEDKPLLIV